MPQTRTRTTLLLPAPSTFPQYLLVDSILTGLTQVCGGVTVSSDLPAVFSGWWWARTTGRVQQDANMLMIADAPVGLRSPNLTVYLDSLKRRAQQDFAQDIIWITIHSVERRDTDDYIK